MRKFFVLWRIKKEPGSIMFKGYFPIVSTGVVYAMLHFMLTQPASAQGTDPPIVVSQPSSQSVFVGSSAQMTVMATNPVQSFFGTGTATNLIFTGQTAGTTEINYSFYGLPDTLHAYYNGALVFDSGPVSYSGTFHITYGPGPVTFLSIIMDEGLAPSPNNLWSFSTWANLPLGYQWLKDSAILAGATTPVLSFKSSQLSNAGVYAVVVSNVLGAVTSQPAVLRVLRSGSAPLLSCAKVPGGLVLSWPTNYQGFEIDAKTNLHAPWSKLTASPLISGIDYTLTNVTLETNLFFRLKK